MNNQTKSKANIMSALLFVGLLAAFFLFHFLSFSNEEIVYSGYCNYRYAVYTTCQIGFFLSIAAAVFWGGCHIISWFNLSSRISRCYKKYNGIWIPIMLLILLSGLLQDFFSYGL